MHTAHGMHKQRTPGSGARNLAISKVVISKAAIIKVAVIKATISKAAVIKATNSKVAIIEAAMEEYN